MKTKLYITLLALCAITITSCKNNLDVLAPGKEAVSVYGILNPNETVQNIRINKVFLTSGDALAAGQDENVINYGPGELLVTLQRFVNGSETPTLTTVGNSTKKEIVLTETVVTTASGNFSSNQRIWQTTDKLYNSGVYKLTIKNISSGAEITAQTVMLDSVKSYQKPFVHNIPNYPAHGQYYAQATGTIQPTPSNGYINYEVLTAPQYIKFLSIPNAKLYNVVLRFHYVDSLFSGGTFPGYIDFPFATQKSNTLAGGELMSVLFTANDFYLNIASEMSKKQTLNIKNRRSFYLEYIITAGADDLNNFLQVNQPSNSIAQDKPYYTNIKGGVGIFSSSSRSIITHDMLNNFIDKIACHPSTSPYLFCFSNGTLAGACPP